MLNGADLLARYLRQRRELGESELIFEGAPLESWLSGLQTTSGEIAPGARSPSTIAAAPQSPARAEVTRRAASAAPAAAPTQPAAPTRVTAAPPSISGAQQPPLLTGPLAELKVFADACTACGLSASRKNVVFGEGSLDAEVIVVGEAPGADEDASGRPFVGAAGKLLDLLLASVGLPRETVYICNVLKCRPPGNRNPSPLEVDACAHLLHGQISSIRPKAILACGTFAAQTLLASTDPLGKLRTAPHMYHGVPLIPTYHPAALLRNPSWVRSVWTDLQRLRQILDA